MRLAVLALVLAVLSNLEEVLDGFGWALADEFVEIARIAAKVLPSQNLLTTLSVFDAQVQCLVKQERLLVTFASKSINLGVLSFLFGEQLGLAFLEDSLNNELVLEVLVGAADADGGVFEDELGVAFRG